MGGIPPQFIESQRAESEKRCAPRSTVSSRRPNAPASPIETRTVNASIAGAAERLGRLARRFDLVIVGQPDRDESAPVEVVDEGVLFESGRPVIFVPYIQKAGLKLDRVMVCWDGSRAATRAIADSLPFLQKAKQVEIVIVANKAGKNDEVPGADLGQHLARHGLEGRRQAHHLAGYRHPLHHPVLCGGYFCRHDRDGRLWPFAPCANSSSAASPAAFLKSMTVPALMSH